MWVFNTLRPGDKLRNPIQGEFFATSTIEGPAQALVRECIQNSLDAKVKHPIRVRIAVHTSNPPNATALGKLFDGAWEHLAADRNGLSAPKPQPGSPCPWLVVEDFNTSGLTGDPEASNDPARDNHFFNFFRAEGVSGKSGSSLGRWGVGKFVFPRSSRASAQFGLTVQADTGRRLLLGSITLLGHRIKGNSLQFTPDGLYGSRRDDGFVLPLTEDREIDSFCQLFDVSRDREPGTSVVVPFIDTADFTTEALLKAVARDYFFPILDGRLNVQIEHDGTLLELSAVNLVDELSRIPQVADEVLPLVRLAKACACAASDQVISLHAFNPEQAAKWTSELMDESARDLIRMRIKTGEPVIVRVPVTVIEKGKGASSSKFDIYLQGSKGFSGRPFFVREGIIISDVRARRNHDILAMVVVDEGPLAVALGNAENPAHTQWQKDGSKFRDYYKYGPGLINFVTGSVSQILSLLNDESHKPDAAPTIDFFSVRPRPEDPAPESSEGDRSKPDPGTKPIGAGEPPASRPTRLAIKRRGDGFSIMAGSEPPPMPFLFVARFAYETRAGNPLKAWDDGDFTLANNQLAVATFGGMKIITSAGNRLVARVDNSDFELAIEGFDASRDLYVRADIMGGSDGDSQA